MALDERKTEGQEMQTDNRVLDSMARFFTNAAGAAQASSAVMLLRQVCTCRRRLPCGILRIPNSISANDRTEIC